MPTVPVLCPLITTEIGNTIKQTSKHLTGIPQVDLLVFESSGHLICKKINNDSKEIAYAIMCNFSSMQYPTEIQK